MSEIKTMTQWMKSVKQQEEKFTIKHYATSAMIGFLLSLVLHYWLLIVFATRTDGKTNILAIAVSVIFGLVIFAYVMGTREIIIGSRALTKRGFSITKADYANAGIFGVVTSVIATYPLFIELGDFGFRQHSLYIALLLALFLGYLVSMLALGLLSVKHWLALADKEGIQLRGR